MLTAMVILISAFANGGVIPPKFTCDGQNVSPAIEWSAAPAQAKSFALILDDPDAPSGLFTHWLLWNIPASTHSLAEAYHPSGGAATGTNDFGKSGYGGPCPPRGTHRYFFRLYALDAPTLDLPAGAKRADLDRALKGHVVANADYMGKYERKR